MPKGSDGANQTKAVVLLSGGLDSATALGYAVACGYRVTALRFRYGQRHRIELEASRRVAHHFGITDHRIVDLPVEAFLGSSLTGQGEVGKGGVQAGVIPATYVPARNTIFLSLALGVAEVLGAQAIFIGVNAVDYSGYPDCRPEFIGAFQAMADRATKAGVEGVGPRVEAPLLRLTKGQIIQLGSRLGVDYGLTSSCYDPSESGAPCGGCDSCRLRAEGFAEAGVRDPLLVRA